MPSHFPVNFVHVCFTHVSDALLFLHFCNAVSTSPVRASWCFVTMARSASSRASFNELRVVRIFSRNSAMYSSQPVASTAHSATARSNSTSVAQDAKSVPHFLLVHVVKDVVHFCFVGFCFISADVRAICAVTPAARQDCSINLSYDSDTSWAVQSGNFLIHSFVAQL